MNSIRRLNCGTSEHVTATVKSGLITNSTNHRVALRPDHWHKPPEKKSNARPQQRNQQVSHLAQLPNPSIGRHREVQWRQQAGSRKTRALAVNGTQARVTWARATQAPGHRPPCLASGLALKVHSIQGQSQFLFRIIETLHHHPKFISQIMRMK